MRAFWLVVFVLSLPLVIQRSQGAVIVTRLAEIYDANAQNNDDPSEYLKLILDFNQDGKSEFVITTSLSAVGVLHDIGNRVFILISAPPNLGGSAASIIGGAEIAGNSGNESFRWYQGGVIVRESFGVNLAPSVRFSTIGLTFSTGSAGHTRGKDGYLGFEFTLEDGLHYAWLHLDASANARYADGSFFGVGGYIDGWAWETTPGKGIIAGAVPEPSVWMLMISAMGGMVLMRKRDLGQ